ncbi:uncharacterized protein BYT42DRAFT_617251 [Radiomyces spectabilis]|uniref:uncharacterized protein n=1 Tax=Radiomyces spectabilis TaxID=64574 RepID=UPI0022207BBD|nr:uncharacterized protein BYT42DRAFT_617251 [Radiomyces spectabilis]KAI8370734.1 hypothetical protein BYT42DRAFT_617251 [Radiomyces spectabilis]
MASHQIAYVSIHGTGLYHFLLEAWILGHNVPRALNLWEEIFALASEGKHTQIFNSIETDGVMVAVKFCKCWDRVPYPQTKKRVSTFPTRAGYVHVDPWDLPSGKRTHRFGPPTARIIGIDPGLRSVITVVDTDENLHDVDERQRHVDSEKQHVYLGPADRAEEAEDRKHGRSLRRTWAYFLGCCDSARISKLSSNVISGASAVAESRISQQWVHKNSTRQRRQSRRAARRNEERPAGPVIVAFGDADLRPKKGNPPIPIKGFPRVLAQKALVICVDEYLTSKVCSRCDSTTVDVRDEQRLRVCNLKKKKKRLRGVDRRLRQRCMNDEGNVLGYSSECPARRPAGRGWQSIVYPVRLCPPFCLSDLDRDINAGINIRRILSGTSSQGNDSILERSPCNDLTAHLLRSAVQAPPLVSC